MQKEIQKRKSQGVERKKKVGGVCRILSLFL